MVDDPILCDFILPANVIRGDLTLSISSQGKAPFFSKKMKEKVEGLIPPVYEDIIHLAGQLRDKITHNQNIDPKLKARILKEFTSKNWEEILSGNGSDSPDNHLKEILSEFNLE